MDLNGRHNGLKSLAGQFFVEGAEGEGEALDEVEGVADVEVEEFLAVLAEEDPRVCVVGLVLVDHDEVLYAGDRRPAVEVQHVGLDGLVPLRRLVLVPLHCRQQLLPFLALIKLVQPLLARDAFREGLRDEGCHLPRPFESEEVGLVLNGHYLLVFVLVDGVVRVSAVRVIVEEAVELGAEEVGD